MSGNSILQWIKSHVVIVICVVVILASLIGGPVVSDGWNKAIAKEVSTRLRKLKELKNGETEFQWPGTPESRCQVFITEPLLEKYQEAADARVSQTGEVVSRLRANNQGELTVVMPELFPTPANPERDLEVLPPELHRRIDAGYDAMLELLHAGTPPTVDEVRAELEARREDFVDRNFMKSAADRLDPEEEKSLREYLTKQRLAFCRDRANDIGVYLSKATLGPPTYVNTQKPSLGEMFQWQWRLWVLERVTAAIADINDDSTEPLASIHRVDRIAVRGLMEVETPAAGDRSWQDEPSGGSGGGSGGMGGMGGMGGGGGRGGSGGRGKAGDAGTVPPAGTRDYARSVTGRLTNEKFDVILVDLDLIVSLDRIDDVLEGFTVPVVMSVVDLEVGRADAFEALGNGEYLGEAPVGRLIVTLETLWLRAWSQELMPDETRITIGIPPRDDNEGASGGSF